MGLANGQQPLISLPDVLIATDEAELKSRLKQALEKIDGVSLPLQQGLTRSSYTDGKDFSVTVLGLTQDSQQIHARVGIFYKGIIVGCNCADDPSPVPELDEYCELELVIDPSSGSTEVTLAD